MTRIPMVRFVFLSRSAGLILVLAITLLISGCSSDNSSSDFKAAEGSTDEPDAKKVNPDWMNSTGSSNPKSTSKSSASVLPDSGGGSTSVAKGKENPNTSSAGTANPTTGKGTPPSGQTGPSGNPPPNTQSAGGTNPTATADGTGMSTELMAKLLDQYQRSQKYYEEMQNQQLSTAAIAEAREKYAKMVEVRLDYANQLLKRSLPERERETVTKLKLDAHQTLAGFNRPEHEKLLYEFGDTLADDPNDNLKKIYEFVKLQKPFNEIVRGNKIDEEAFLKRFGRIVSFWRDDIEVYQRAELWISGLYKSGNRSVFVNSLELAADAFFQSTNEQLLTRSAILKDRLLLAKLDFDLIITDVANGKEGSMVRLLECVKRVLAQPDLSAYVLTQVVQAGLQLEIKHDYQLAREYYSIIEKKLASIPNQRLKESIGVLVANAFKRYDMIGKPIKVKGMIPSIEGGQFTRKPIDFSAYRGKVVILFFWAVANQPSYQLLRDLDRFYMENQDKDFVLIGVNADKDTNVIAQVMQFEVPKRKWIHLMPNNPTSVGLNSEMAKNCGVDSMPYNILIDKKGNVSDIRVYGTILEDKVSELLGEEVKRIYASPQNPAPKQGDPAPKQGDPAPKQGDPAPSDTKGKPEPPGPEPNPQPAAGVQKQPKPDQPKPTGKKAQDPPTAEPVENNKAEEKKKTDGQADPPAKEKSEASQKLP
ncbi:thioredoxin-like domain-containing protein [Pirellulaceae bacterium]|nr:thioredoxin-like domain-containing protein [Pirellulaceae bacterium]